MVWRLRLEMLDFIGGRTRTRTLDPLIKSQLLYHLSYAPFNSRMIRLRNWSRFWIILTSPPLPWRRPTQGQSALRGPPLTMGLLALSRWRAPQSGPYPSRLRGVARLT